MNVPDGTNSLSRRDANAIFHPYTNAIANRDYLAAALAAVDKRELAW